MNWFDEERENDIDASEFVDNCNEILIKLRAIESLGNLEITLDQFWQELQFWKEIGYK